MNYKSSKTASRTIVLPLAEYERLIAKAGEGSRKDGPPLPQPDARGNTPAVEYIRASIAREIIQRRREAGLSQMALATLSGLRQETISNLETAKHTVTAATMEKIDKALHQATRRSKAQQARKRRSA